MYKAFLIPCLLCTLIYFSCAKQGVTSSHAGSNSDTTGNPASDSTYYYSFTLDSISYTQSFDVNGYSIGTFAGNQGNTGSVILAPGEGIFSGPSILDTTSFDEVIGNIPSGVTLQAFYDSLRPRALQYTKGDSGGVIIAWDDPHNVLWKSNMGTADQTGSNFIITSTSYSNSDSVIINVSASFNCNLYDNAGDMKTITNGHTRMFFLGP
jgi:hypothetical protein